MNEMIETVATATNPDPLSAFDLSANIPATDSTPIANATTAIPASSSTTALPTGYLDGDNGFMETDGAHHFPNAAYVDRFARDLATALSTGTPAMSAAAFRSAFLRDAKKKLRRGTPNGVKLTTVATMRVQAIKLVSQQKAPPILRDMIDKTATAVTNAETFEALYNHLDAVYSFMLLEQQKGGEE